MADPAIFPNRRSLFAKMLASGTGQERELQRDAQALMDKMIAIHGGAWSAEIDHRSRFIMIAYDGDIPIANPGKGRS